MTRWVAGQRLWSPQDAIALLECDHRFSLDRAVDAELLPRPAVVADGTLELVVAHGLLHESAVLEDLESRWTVVRVESPARGDEALLEAAARTRKAMEAGVDAVYQAVLLTDDFLGYCDFLISRDPETDQPLVDGEGRRRYEPVDAKLARAARPSALLQVGCYAAALVAQGWPPPQRVHLWLGDGTREAVPAGDVLPLVAEYRERVVAGTGAVATVPVQGWGDARPACATCRWDSHCDAGRRASRDLSLVAGIRRDQVARLRAAGATTIDRLGSAPDALRPVTMGRETFERLRAQARLQVRGEHAPLPEVEVVDASRLAALPRPDPGDLYYDIEGDPFAEGGDGIEYLHGVVTAEDGHERFEAFWGHDRAGEKAAFEGLVDHLVDVLRRHPAAHVYHYASYERTALARLASRHGTREAEVDDLLRRGRLIDLYDVVRHSVRVSTESYSIKKLEPLYMGDRLRESDVQTAGDSIVEYERAVAAAAVGEQAVADEILEQIRDYNEYDCLSTRGLHRWLESLAAGHGVGSASGVDQPLTLDQPADAQPAPHHEVVSQLLAGVPGAVAERTEDQQVRALLASAIGYHRRNQRPDWWEHFDRLRRSREELLEDDEVVLLDRVEASAWTTPPRARTLWRELQAVTGASAEGRDRLGSKPFLVYDSPVPAGMVPGADSARATHARTKDRAWEGQTLRVSEGAGTGSPGWSELPMALLPSAAPGITALEDVLGGLGTAVLDGDVRAAWWDLLGRAPARVPGEGLPRNDDDVSDVERALRATPFGVLSVQGPPGTGKTYLGARVIARLARSGWRVGVTAQGHQAIENLLAEVRVADPDVVVAKEGSGARDWQQPSKLQDWMGGQQGGFVVGGTSWTFARPALRAHHLDLMVVDEAGQLSLADALVSGSAADRLLLLGDPQQLAQVSQGSHSEAVDVSALGHVMGGLSLLPPSHGYLLSTSYRMHPQLCRPVSELQYEGVLTSHPRCSDRALDGVEPGLHLVPVDHADNRVRSDEEVDAVVRLAQRLVGRGWRDGDSSRALAAADVLVVAPFNAQVAALRRALVDAGLADVAVGTVDRFQGREAPVVIVSMATSSGQDLPRGLEFLLSRNRLNVAISRAQWAAYLVHSPLLRQTAPTSVAGLQALGAFLGLLRR